MQTRGLATAIPTRSHHQPSLGVCGSVPSQEHRALPSPTLEHMGSKPQDRTGVEPSLGPSPGHRAHTPPSGAGVPSAQELPAGNALCWARAMERYGKEGRVWRRQPRALVTLQAPLGLHFPVSPSQPGPAAHSQGTGDGTPQIPVWPPTRLEPPPFSPKEPEPHGGLTARVAGRPGRLLLALWKILNPWEVACHGGRDPTLRWLWVRSRAGVLWAVGLPPWLPSQR